MELSEQPNAAKLAEGRFPSRKSLCTVVNVSWFFVLAVMILVSPHACRYDEVYHLEAVERTQTQGFKAALTSPENKSAAGPLFSMVQLAFAPATNLRAPAVRWINWFCLCLIVAILASTQSVSGVSFYCASSLIGVPFLWPPAGLALTELCPMLTFTLFLVLMLKSLSVTTSYNVRSLCLSAIAGIALGVSILGRQTYLVALVALLPLALLFPQRSFGIGVCVAIAACTCGWLFFVWGGLVPPSLRQIDSSLRLDHGLCSFSYLGAAMLVLAPRWLMPRSWSWLILACVIGACLTAVVFGTSNSPAASLLPALFGKGAGMVLGVVIRGAITTLGVLFVFSLLRKTWEQRDRFDKALVNVLLLALAFAPIKVSHLFSSRYVVGALPLLILMAADYLRPNLWNSARISCAAALGAGTLWTYYAGQ